MKKDGGYILISDGIRIADALGMDIRDLAERWVVRKSRKFQAGVLRKLGSRNRLYT